MTEQHAGPKGPSLEFPIPIKPGSPNGEGRGGNPKTTDDLYNDVMVAMKKNVELVGAARASKIVGTPDEGDQPARPETDGRSAVRPFQDLNDAAQIFGINFSQMMEQKATETQALREATDTKDREIHELRLNALTEMEERIRNVATERRGGGGDLGSMLGLGELDPEVRRRIQERALRLDQRPEEDHGEPKQPTLFTLDWFKQWGDLEPSVQAVARMFGMIPKEEAGSNQQAGSMVTMEDVRSGKVPTELVVSLRKVETEADLERVRIEKEDARENRRLDIFGQISTTLKDNVGDFFSTVRDLATEHGEAAEREGARGTGRGGSPELMGIKCEDCGYVFRVEQELEHYTCPSCGVGLDVTPALKPTLDEKPATNGRYIRQGEHGKVLSV